MNDTNDLNLNRYFMWGLAALFYFYESTLQVSQAVMADDLMRDLNITANSLSVLTSTYFWGYACIQIPVGLIIDRFGIRKPLCFAILSCIVGAIAYAYAYNIYAAGFSRLLIGIGSAFAALSALQIAATLFPASRFAFLTGLLLTAGMCGEMFGEAPLNTMVTTLGWRTTNLFLGLFGFLIIALVVTIMSEPHRKNGVSHQASKTYLLKTDLLKLVQQLKPWLIALYGMFMFTPFLILVGLWGIPFIQHAGSHSHDLASTIMLFMPAGFAVGAPIIGWLSDHYQTRKIPLILSSIGQTCSISYLLLHPGMSIASMKVTIFLIGFSCSGFLPSFSVMKEITCPNIRIAALGFMNTFNMIGVPIFMPIVGIILDHLWNHSSQGGHPIYSILNYQQALMLLPVMSLLALIIIQFVPESFTKKGH